MSNISEWTTAAAGNNDAPPDGFPEGQAPGSLNDASREVMAAMARLYADQDGTLVTAGSATAYTLTTTQGHTAIADQSLMVFRAHAANTGPATLDVDGTGAQSIRLGGVAIAADVLVVNALFVAVYNATANAYDLLGGYSINNDAWAGTDLAIVNGGTGASTAGAARTNLGVEIGSDVQAHDADLDAIAALDNSDSNFIVGSGSGWVVESGATARTSLGLGSLATASSINDSNWSGTDLAVANGGTGGSTAANARTNLGLGSIAVRNVTVSTSGPSGGANGDFWFVREA